METKHTKGEWRIYKMNKAYHINAHPSGDHIASLIRVDMPNAEANAKLIAASPQQQMASILLYKLCMNMAEMLNGVQFTKIRDQWNVAMIAHEQAIDKATK
jgi:hypothetical protein